MGGSSNAVVRFRHLWRPAVIRLWLFDTRTFPYLTRDRQVFEIEGDFCKDGAGEEFYGGALGLGAGNIQCVTVGSPVACHRAAGVAGNA